MLCLLNMSSYGVMRRSFTRNNVLSSVAGMRSISDIAAMDAEIKTFPEYKLASEQEGKGQYSLALPNYMRVKDVMKSTTGGPFSNHTAMVSIRIGKLLCSMGKYEDARKELGEIELYPDNHFKVHAYQVVSISRMMEGLNVSAALDAATQATAVCENLRCHSEKRADHYYLFSKNYTLEGLSCLLLGKLIRAEEHLHLAARWADNPTDKLISLSNIGSLFCTMANFTPPSYDDSSLSFPPKEVATTSRDSVRKSTLIRDGVDYWKEALIEANLPSTVAGAASVSTETSPPGHDVATPTVPTDKGSGVNPIESAPGLDTADISVTTDSLGTFTTAYVTILCNMAEAEVKLGDKSSAAQHLSAALAAIKLNTENFPNNDFLLSPVLGRSLYLSACNYFHSGDFVLAEGLFKASISKFQQNTYCEVDARHAYELSRAMHSYGLLLQKWEKRESEGETWIARSNALRATMPLFPVHNSSSPQEHMSHFLLMLPT